MSSDRKIALVTGVSRHKGIGKAICLALAKKGMDICFTYWSAYDELMPWDTNASEPAEIKNEILALGVRCDKIEIDFAEDSSPKTIFDFAELSLGKVDVLINNATHSTDSAISDISDKILDDHYMVNVKTATMLIKEFVNRSEESTSGRVVNMTSGQSLGQMNSEIAYAMTKGAIETLTKTIYSELAEKGITINAVNPGPNDTGWMDEKLKTELTTMFPMGRLGQPTDAAKLVAFLCSEEAQWITGQVIHCEGGFVR